jgi:hypothetical protein
MEETNVVSSPGFGPLRFYVPTSLSACISPIPLVINPNMVAFDLCGICGVEVDTFIGIFHEFFEQDKRKELTFGVFKSPHFINAKDVEVNHLHMILDLKGVLVGKDYFRINHLLPSRFNLTLGQERFT